MGAGILLQKNGETTMSKKIANVRWQGRDWKESIDVKWLQKAMKEVQVLGHGCQVLDGSDAVNMGDDSLTTVVCPANVEWKAITESDVLGYCDEIHAAPDGTLSFRFLEEDMLPSKDWMDEKTAQAHVDLIIEKEDKAYEAQRLKEMKAKQAKDALHKRKAAVTKSRRKS